MKLFLRMGTTARVGASVAVLSVLIAAPASAQDSPLSRSTLSGWHSPAGGPKAPDGTDPSVLNLVVAGRSEGTDLTNATLTVDGAAVGGPVDFGPCPAEPQACTTANAALPDLDTKVYPDGTHRIVATVHDDAGNAYSISKDIEFWNNRGPNCSPSCDAQLSIGSDPTAAPAAPGPKPPSGGGVQGANETSCKSPRLSMSLSQKPLRVSHGVPVLLKNKRYRFTGRLTCLVGKKRRSAPKGTRIQVRNTVHRKTVRKPSGKVGSGGKIRLILKYPSSRTIEFRFTNGDKKTSKVRIKVRISQRKR
jgi:hypothetical protein